eukprot:CAMPEP_0183794678 /NCGR_PEP_ID=MMETSP0803_2-20130417/3983_1 /TAXON_ID=195967 /ORGANISM="Crustomastix stigmata, Strain CCMP3273" /LENGTH=195 /DNA_ID=CAMNT_0026039085 /DNA_START=44 /DNA_END=627 /DNA_ORIENTATION=-
MKRSASLVSLAAARVESFNDLTSLGLSAGLGERVRARLKQETKSGPGLQKRRLLEKFGRTERKGVPTFGAPLDEWRKWAKSTRRKHQRTDSQKKALLLAKFATLGLASGHPSFNADISEWQVVGEGHARESATDGLALSVRRRHVRHSSTGGQTAASRQGLYLFKRCLLWGPSPPYLPHPQPTGWPSAAARPRDS